MLWWYIGMSSVDKRVTVERFHNLLESIIIILMCGFILVDMINGYLIRNGIMSISILFKLLILGLIVIDLFRNKILINKIGGLIFILLGYLIIHFFIVSDLLIVLSGLDWLIKFISIVIFYLFFSYLIKNNKEEKIFLFAKYSFIFLVFNFLLGFLGFGYHMYGNEEAQIGTKGFIFAGNEISAAIIVSGAMLQMRFIENKEYKKFIIIAVLMLTMGGLLTSKVSIIASILITLFFPLIKASENLKYLKMKKQDFYFSSVILIFIPMVSIGVIYYALFVANLMDRLTYFYAKVDLVTLIFSSRNIWAIEAINAFYYQYTFFEYLFGASQGWFSFIGEDKMVEIDFIDFLMTYGIIGVFFSYGFLGFFYYKLIKYKYTNPYYGYLFFILFLIISMSLTSGHILNSGIAGALIGALFSMVNYKKDINI
jgi:hypothetical protein